MQELVTPEVKSPPSGKCPHPRSRKRRFIAVACLGMVGYYAYYAYTNRPAPEIDYVEVVPPIVMISATHDGDGEGWLADGMALEPEAVRQVRVESGDNEKDGKNQLLILWRHFDEHATARRTITGPEIFDVSGSRIPRVGLSSSTSNRWDQVGYRFRADAVLPEVVDLKWQFGSYEEQELGSIKADGSNLPIYLPNGSRIIEVGDSTRLQDHKVEPNRLYVRTEYVRQPDANVSISFRPQWRFPFTPPDGAGATANSQQCLSVRCNYSQIEHWDRPHSDVQRIDIVSYPMRTEVYRNVSTRMRDTPSDFYVAIEPRRWSVTPGLSIEDPYFDEGGAVEIEITWPATEWRLRNPESQRRWKSYLRFNGVEKEWPDGPPPFESSTKTFNCHDMFGVTIDFPDTRDRNRLPGHLQYVIKDVDVVHPEHEGRVFHVPEIKSWSNSLRRRKTSRPEEHVVQATR